MKLHHTPLKGAFILEPSPHADDRGFFARLFCQREFREAGLEDHFIQVNNSYNKLKGTLRGLHYQLPPASEVKIVRCIRGAVHDVILDLRPDSPSYRQSYAAELNDKNLLMMYVPRGVAHGMLSLRDDTEVIYWVSDPYTPERERGVRWDDKYFKIAWPKSPISISAKDANWPDFDPLVHEVDALRGIG